MAISEGMHVYMHVYKLFSVFLVDIVYS